MDHETADAFVNYVREKITSKHTNKVENLRKVLYKTGILELIDLLGRCNRYYFSKRILLYELKGISKTDMNTFGKQYYQEVIKKHFIIKMIEQMKQDQKNGYRIVIVSASYSPILEPFCKEFHIDSLITNTLKYDNNDVFIGKLDDKDCVYKNKVKKFLKKYPNFFMQVKHSKSYGDSYSDIPILSIAEQGYVISYKRHKKWVEKTNFKEIFWE